MTGFFEQLKAEVAGYAGPDADLIKLAPNLFKTLANLLDEPTLDASLRMQVAAAMGYFVSPFDAVPESEGPHGWLDDIFVALHVLRAARDSVGDGPLDLAWNGQNYSSQMLDDSYERCRGGLHGQEQAALRFVGLDLVPTDV